MKFTAKTLFGLESTLAEELADLGASDIVQANRAVRFTGNMRTMYTVNYMSRTALSVLWQIDEFRISSADDLYRKALRTEWDRFLDPDMTFSINAVVKSRLFTHSGFPALRLKDAVADYFRNRSGRRPSVDTSEPDLNINLHISSDRVTVSLDSSGDPLFKRGYRKYPGSAPLNEVLAAGMIRITGWDGRTTLSDPMCGSGTIPVEAALMAYRIPPGSFRKNFGFQKWKAYDRKLYLEVKREFDDQSVKSEPVSVSGYDISPEAVRIAAANAENAGLKGLVRFEQADFSERKPAGSKGILILNPPYGERISQGKTDSLYAMIGTTLKHHYHGYDAWLISPNIESIKQIGLKPSVKYRLFNGALECLYLRYELYTGSRKAGMTQAS